MTHTKSQKRILIAKDVLKWIKQGKLTAGSGYFKNQSELYGPNQENLDEQANAILPTIPTCQVCAIGGLMYATAMRFNDITVEQFTRNLHSGSPYLAKFFTPAQLRIIEICLELWKNEGASTPKTVAWVDANCNTPRLDRLKKIMRNIIRNKGTFKP